MVIGIDGNEANVQHQVGVSVYTLKLLNYFQKKASKEVQFKIYLRNTPSDILPKETSYFSYVVIPGKFLWSQIFLPLYLKTHTPPDVFFAPAHYSPRFFSGKLVVTIHDLSYIYFPNEFLKKDLYKLTTWTAQSVQKAAKIIAVSKTTKKDILSHYDIDTTQVEVIYNGFEKHATGTINEMEVLERLNLQKKSYILYVGTVQPRKNIQHVIRAMKKVHITHPELRFVVVGKKGWLYEEIFSLVKELKLEDTVIFTGYLPDNEVIQLYKNALSYVHPSLYEGFGIPILEAMSYKCPVIASAASSLPEIGGEACLYFDPTNIADLADDIIQMIERPELRKELIEKGSKRMKEFSWDMCAEQTLQLLIKQAQGS